MLHVILSFMFSSIAMGMDQFVLVFDAEKAFETSIDEQSLVLRVANSTPQDFQTLDHYSDLYIRRVIVKEIGGDITEARIVVRSPDIKIAVYSFNEPFRIVIDIYDVQEQRVPAAESLVAISQSDSKDYALRRPDVARTEYDSKWHSYPLYMFRLDHLPSMIVPNADSAVFKSAAEAFDKGNDAQALKAYQELLVKHSQELADSPGHLWRYGEVHFGMGNANFADGYFQVLARKYQGSLLAAFAELRRLDIATLHTESLSDLLFRLDQIQSLSHNPDFKAAVTLRKAFWQNSSMRNDTLDLPSLSRAQAIELLNILPQMKSEKGQFVAGVMAYMTGPPYDFKRLASFLEKFKGPASEPYRSMILQQFSSHLATSINDLSQKNANVELISLYESLGQTLAASIRDRTSIQRIAEAYSRSARPEKAAEIYASLPSSSEAEELEATLKASMNAAQSVFVRTIQNQPTDQFAKLAAENDRLALSQWSALNDKDAFYDQHKDQLVSFAQENYLLRTPTLIVLDAWKKSLIGGKSPIDQNIVNTILNVADKFKKLGLTKEEQESLSLLRYVKPTSESEKTQWSKAMSDLAGRLRQANQYLEAGRVYAASADYDDAQRVNNLYRGALLIARAGNRDEAIGLLERCSQDTSNLYYANLCNERLDRMRNRD